jgi:uncharacterized membrane protein YhaH (DUF805 family)
MFVFNGRARRLEFWWYFLICVDLFAVWALILMACGVFSSRASFLSSEYLIAIPLVPFYMAFFSLMVRRSHDMGYSGWLVVAFALLLAAGFLALYYASKMSYFPLLFPLFLAFGLKRGQRAPNKYGEAPPMLFFRPKKPAAAL